MHGRTDARLDGNAFVDGREREAQAGVALDAVTDQVVGDGDGEEAFEAFESPDQFVARGLGEDLGAHAELLNEFDDLGVNAADADGVWIAAAVAVCQDKNVVA